MKKHFNFKLIAVIAIILTLSTAVFLSASAGSNKGKGNGNSKKTTATESTDSTDPLLYGRLVIESVDINVALYNSNSQATCDAEDSACIYSRSNATGVTIADHNYQDFKTLTSVEENTTATIVLNNGGKIYLNCVETYDGKNTGYGLTDADGNSVTGQHDYITYTCIPGAGNIRICQWDIVGAENTDKNYDKNYKLDKQTTKAINAYVTDTQKGNGKKK